MLVQCCYSYVRHRRHVDPYTKVVGTLWLTLYRSLVVTRSYKYNDRDHAGLADGTAAPQEYLPRYFGKNGFEGADPKKIKKQGGGRGNWYAHSSPLTVPSPFHILCKAQIRLTFNVQHRGAIGEEILDEEDFNFTQPRRRSNSSGFAHRIRDFKTKFDVNEPEPVFEESIHGPQEEESGEDVSNKTEPSDSGRSSDDEKLMKK